MRRLGWKTRLGFYLATIGSAFGLGNLWRFPYVVGENGGGAFVLIYILFALLIGLPLLVTELALGKSSRKSVMAATQALRIQIGTLGVSGKWIGRLPVILSLVVLAYYSVISGWVLHFLMQFGVHLISSYEFNATQTFRGLLESGVLQIALSSVHLILASVVVLKGVQEGLEKWVGWLMPAFAILMVILVTKTLSLPSAPEALRFLFYPNFSKLSSSSILYALGQVLFTLSLGFGTMVTFGSYLDSEEHVPTAAFRITVADTLLSLVAGLVVFPIALSAGSIETQDPGLLFAVLPEFLLGLPGGVFFGLLFFLCLYLASLSASIGLLEVIVSNAMEWKRFGRTRSTWIVVGLAMMISMVPALSGTFLKAFTSGQIKVLEILDFGLINVCLPVISFLIVLLVGRSWSNEQLEANFVHQEKVESVALFPYWKWSVQVGVLLMVAFIWILQIF